MARIVLVNWFVVFADLHLEPKQLPELPLQCFAEVSGAWTTQDPAILSALDALHTYAEGFLQTRLKWRAKEPLTLLELRCFQLQQPLIIPTRTRVLWVFLVGAASRRRTA